VDCRAWHLAVAADGPDEATAAELERGAAWAHARGGWAAGAAFMARAAELTPDGPRKTDRVLSAAEAAVVAGTPARAHALLRRAHATFAGLQQVARARRVEAALQSLTVPGRVPAILLQAATARQPIDAVQARDTFIEALQACLVSSQLTAGTTPREVGTAALAADAPAAEPDIADLMLDAFATRFAIGYPEAVPALQRAVAALSSDTMDTMPPAGLTRWSILGNSAANDLWDADGYQRMLTRLEQAGRQRGALDSLRMTLGGLGHCLMWAGDFAGAEVAHSEATQIGVALGEDATMYEALKVELFAWQGRDDDVRSAAGFLPGKQIEIAGGGVRVNIARLALVVLDLARGRYDDALATASKVMADDPANSFVAVSQAPPPRLDHASRHPGSRNDLGQEGEASDFPQAIRHASSHPQRGGRSGSHRAIAVPRHPLAGVASQQAAGPRRGRACPPCRGHGPRPRRHGLRRRCAWAALG
jgi:tetratricopeptide (TPR) repeat protein